MARPPLQVVEELFHRAVALDPAQRAAFLDSECAGDAELQSAVEDLVKQDELTNRTASFLISPVASAAEQLRPPGDTHEATSQNLTVFIDPSLPAIPGYEILGELGRGGMGVVYKARQSSLNRIVALKMLLLTGNIRPQLFDRFRTEAEALARLHHPNIVAIYDIDQCEGRPYFTMEYVAGPSLAQMLDGRPQDVAATARLIETLARAIHTVHECGIIHRDLKPANILMEGSGVSGQEEAPSSLTPDPSPRTHSDPSPRTPKISDFGLAKDLSADQDLTQTGFAMGTPGYMAPEQARGKKGKAGPAADTYALGSILYEMMTGRPPFEAGSAAETLIRLLSDEPLSPLRLRPSLPRDLVTICLKCLEKSPRKRYTTALDLAEDLQRFQTGRPVHARPVGPVERTYRWCRRRPLVASLLAFSGLLLVAFIITVIDYDVRLRSALAKVQAQSEDRRQQIVQLHINLGITDLEVGDDFAALLHFTEVLRLDEGSPEEPAHRRRIAAILRHHPQLVRLWALEQPVLLADPGDFGGKLLTFGEDGRFEAWDVHTGRRLAAGPRLDEVPASGAISADGRFLATGSANGSVRLLDLNTGTFTQLPGQEGKLVSRLAFHPDAQVLVITREDHVVRCWDLTTDPPTPRRQLAERPYRLVSLSDNGRWLFTLDGNNLIAIWDLATGKTIGASWKVDQAVRLAALSPDGRRVALVGPDSALGVWDVATAQRLGPPRHPAQPIRQAGFSPDAEQLFTLGSDQTIQFWELQSGALVARLSTARGPVTDARFSPDGHHLLISSPALGVRVWDLAMGKPATPWLPPAGTLKFASFSADGKQVVTISQEGMVRSWEWSAGGWQQEELTADPRPVAELIALAQVLSGRCIDEKQSKHKLEPSQLRSAWAQLKQIR